MKSVYSFRIVSYLLTCLFCLIFFNFGTAGIAGGQVLTEPILLNGSAGVVPGDADPVLMLAPGGYIVIWNDTCR